MKGFKQNGKFIPLVKTHKPSIQSYQALVSRHAPDGTFTHDNPRTRQKETIKLRKIEALNNDSKEHVLIGTGSDGRPISKIIS